jgi:hypothetical protein
MRFNKLSWIGFLFPALCWAGGGLVGNGAGLAEQDFVFAFESLPKSIQSCFENATCAPNEAETQALKEIQAIAKRNSLRPSPLVFVSGNQSKGFFDLSSNEPFRIAKTGLDPDSPIWINTDLLYQADGRPSLDFAAATAILIHEVGHQTGRTDHAFLDLAAAKVRSILQDNLTHLDLNWFGTELSVRTLDYALSTLSMDVTYSFGSSEERLNALFQNALICPGELRIPLGFRLVNGHWSHPIVDGAQGKVSYIAWARFSCINHGEVETQSADVEIQFLLKQNSQNANDWSMQDLKIVADPAQTRLPL